MRPAEPLQTLARTCLRALVTHDLPMLESVALPHPGLATLLDNAPNNAAPPANRDAIFAELDNLQMFTAPIFDDQQLLTVYFRGSLHLLIATPTPDGTFRLDLRWWIAAAQPRSEREETARAYYYYLLTSNLEGLQALSIDTRGLEMLCERQSPSGEHGQLEHVAQTMALVELAPGDSYPTPRGVEKVDERHAKAGLTVLLGLTPEGLMPFVMKQIDGKWKCSPANYIMAAALARGGKITPA